MRAQASGLVPPDELVDALIHELTRVLLSVQQRDDIDPIEQDDDSVAGVRASFGPSGRGESAHRNVDARDDRWPVTGELADQLGYRRPADRLRIPAAFDQGPDGSVDEEVHLLTFAMLTLLDLEAVGRKQLTYEGLQLEPTRVGLVVHRIERPKLVGEFT